MIATKNDLSLEIAGLRREMYKMILAQTIVTIGSVAGLIKLMH